jgi:hypothetical protein
MIAWHPAPRHLKIQGSKGQSVLNRSTYTAAGYVTLKSKIQIKTPRAEIKYHQLYFPISDHDFGDDPLEIWHMAIDAEPRWDAVQAWKSEFTFPRCLNLEQQIEFANRFAEKINELGLFVQIDIHHSTATDGGINPHLHATISDRCLTKQGFHSHKSAEVREFFELERGKLASEFIRDVLNEIGFRDLGEKKITTLETNAERKLPSPEPRLPRRYFKKANEGQHRKVLEVLFEIRKQRQDFINNALSISDTTVEDAIDDPKQSSLNKQRSAQTSEVKNGSSDDIEVNEIEDDLIGYLDPESSEVPDYIKKAKPEESADGDNGVWTTWRDSKAQEYEKFNRDFGLIHRLSLTKDKQAETVEQINADPVEATIDDENSKPTIP